MVAIEYVKGIFKKLPSDSSDSVTHQLLLPSFAELPNEFNTPPLIIVGSKLAAVKILDTNDVVVVLPCEPVITTFLIKDTK